MGFGGPWWATTTLNFAADLQTILHLEASISSTPSWTSSCLWGWSEIEQIMRKIMRKNGWFLKWFQVVLEINGMKWNYQSHDYICFWSFVWFVLKLCRTNVHFLKLHLNFNAILKPEEWPESSWPRFMAQLAQAQVPSKSGNEVMIGSAIRVFLRLDSFYFYLY